MKRTISTLTIGALLAGAAHANLITNGSFEEGVLVPNGDNTMALNPGSTDITGWVVQNSSVAWIADPNPFNGVAASDGVRSLDLTGYSEGPGGVSQSFGTVVGAEYTVTFDQGANPAYGQSTIRVLAAGDSEDFTLTSNNGQLWATRTWTFTAVSSVTTLEIGHYFGGDVYTGLDNVVVTGQPVPEPATLSLLALVPMALRRRARR